MPWLDQKETPLTAHKYARIETERRFLLAAAPPDLDESDAHRIIDRYWPGTRLRLRRIETLSGQVIQSKLTQKYLEPQRPTTETVITNTYLTAQEYDLLAQLPGLPLVKRRTAYPYQGWQFGIDVFEGALDGLVLAEVEAQNGQLWPGDLPSFARCEVTAEKAFTGGGLVQMDAAQLRALLVAWLDEAA